MPPTHRGWPDAEEARGSSCTAALHQAARVSFSLTVNDALMLIDVVQHRKSKRRGALRHQADQAAVENGPRTRLDVVWARCKRREDARKISLARAPQTIDWDDKIHDMSSPWTKIASLYDGPRAVGGSLEVGGGRLRFRAHAIDKALRGREVDFPLETVERLELTRRSLLAPRRHVLVETSDGVRARFLVNGAKGVLEAIARDSREAGSDPAVIGLD